MDGEWGGVRGGAISRRLLSLPGDAGVIGGDWRGLTVERRLTRLATSPIVAWCKRSVSSCLCSSETIRWRACSSLRLCWDETGSIVL